MTSFFTHFEDLPGGSKRAVCLGNFDGLHRGHQKVLDRCYDRAQSAGLVPLIFTFDPHPRRFLGRDGDLRLLLTLDEKKEMLSDLGFDELLIQDFNQAFAEISANDFVTRLERLGVEVVCFGRDFRFGRYAKGSRETIESHSQIEVEEVDALDHQGQSISSGQIRKLLAAGELTLANEMLGYPYFVTGQVVRGQGRGRILGFPTLNLDSQKECLPAPGVFISLVEDLEQRSLMPAVSNLGWRPSFESEGYQIEAHLLNFEGDLYGRSVRLYLIEGLRPEQAFASVEDLRRQVSLDIQKARQFFARHLDFSALFESASQKLSLGSRFPKNSELLRFLCKFRSD